MNLRGLISTLAGAALLSLVIANTVLPSHGTAAKPEYYHFEAKVTSSVDGIVQVFYNTGRNFNEGDSATAPISARQPPAVLSFPLDASAISGIRFDPINAPGTATVSDVRIRRPDGSVLKEFQPEAFTAVNDIARTSIDGGTLTIETKPGANDPYLFLDLGTPEISLPVPRLYLVTPYFRHAAPVFGVLLVLLAAGQWYVRGRRERLAQRFAALWAGIRARPKTAVAAAAFAAMVLSSYPVIFCGASFVSPNYGSSLLYDGFPTLPGSKATETVDVRGADIGAIMWSHVPLSIIQSRALLHDHELPLWNRYDSAGTVLLGQSQSMFGDPLHLIPLLAGGAAWAWDIKYLVAKWLMGLGLGLIVWRTARDLPAALIVAFASIFVGFFVFRVNHPAYFSFCYGPWVLYAWCFIAGASTRRGAVAGMLGLLLANWTLMVSGTAKEAYISLLTMNFAGGVMLLVAAHPGRERLVRLGLVTAAGGVFLMLAAPIWLTFYDSLKASYSSYNAAFAFQLQPSLALGFFDEILLRPFWEGEKVYNPSSNFLLLLGVLAYLVNLRRLAANRYALGFGLGALLPVVFVFGFVPPRWIALWPFLGNVHHIDNSFGVGLIHLIAVLAGFGFAAAGDRLRRREGWGDLALAGLLLFALVLHYIGLTQTVQRSTITFLLWGQTVARSGVVWGSLVVLLAAAVALALGVRRGLALGRMGPGLALTLLACFIALLWRHGMQLHSPFPNYTLNAAPRASFSARSPALQAMAKDTADPARAFGFGSCLFPGWNGAYFIEGVNGPDALMNPYLRELQDAFKLERIWDWRLFLLPANLPPVRAFFDLLNVRYFLDYHGDQGLVRSLLTPVLMADLELYRNDTAWPRAFFTDRLAAYRKPAEFADLVRAAGGRPLAAVQSTDPAEPAGLATDNLDGRLVVPAEHYQLTNNTTGFTVNAPGPGFIVLTENWMKGDFRVTLNGADADYFRVNHAFKGVQVDRAGTYRVVFRYYPHHFTLSLGLALAALAILGAVVRWLWRTRPLPAAAA
jgi:hypothetical protein